MARMMGWLNSCRSQLSRQQQQQRLLSTASWSSFLSSSSSSSLSSWRFLECRSYHANNPNERHGTTIVCVRKNGSVCMMGDGMVSMGSVVVKPNAKKIRRIPSKTASTNNNNNDNDNDETKNDATLVGFAGSTADAFTLLERLEGKLDEYPGQLARSCVELAKGWRTDKYLRRLEASLIVADPTISLEITGNGDVLEPHDGILGVGSGSMYAVAAARALIDIPELSAEDVARKAMNIAGDMCIYTNKNFLVETIDVAEEEEVDGETKKEEEKKDDEN